MIARVKYGPHELKPWYQNPGYIDFEGRNLKSYRVREPRPMWSALGTDPPTSDSSLTLWLCPHCLLYTSSENDLKHHIPRCRFIDGDMPGRIVYDAPDFIVRRLDLDEVGEACGEGSGTADNTLHQSVLPSDISQAAKNSSEHHNTSLSRRESLKLYMQCVALLGRLFLDTKSLCFSLSGFWLDVAYDRASGLMAGFYSREKESWHDYNLACIVVLPPFQNCGLGQLLIGFSYWWTRQEGAFGSPEKPLSEHGQRAYLSYWTRTLALWLLQNGRASPPRSLRDLGKNTGIDPEDIATALETMGALQYKKGDDVRIDLCRVAEAAAAMKPSKGGFREEYACKLPLIPEIAQHNHI